MMRLTTIAKKIETLFDNYRSSELELATLKDVRVEVENENGRVLITYDGDGNWELNYHNHYPTGLRVDLKKLVNDLGFYAEDINNWSMGVYHA